MLFLQVDPFKIITVRKMVSLGSEWCPNKGFNHLKDFKSEAVKSSLDVTYFYTEEVKIFMDTPTFISKKHKLH